jgi:microcystin degradation protein MlrC
VKAIKDAIALGGWYARSVIVYIDHDSPVFGMPGDANRSLRTRMLLGIAHKVAHYLGDPIRVSAQPAARELTNLHFALHDLIAEQLPHVLVELEVLNLELDALV